MEKECHSPTEVTSLSPTWTGIGLVLLFYGLESVICIHCIPNQVWQRELHLQSKREGRDGGGEVVPAHTHWWECLEWQRLWLRHDPDQKDLAPFFMANLLFRCTRIFSKNYFWCVFFMKKSWFSNNTLGTFLSIHECHNVVEHRFLAFFGGLRHIGIVYYY